ncbi:hypothetical protein GOBAR_AA03341 [Gossypium barbadense]|uniref:Uncharacterized protein n=1 Tax=Gossypium barbadense TaxID=3634 RepID=A0A2P5YNQ3_GOSBA|nr:hypothetical protein GOBAR_AA03341 [Gossypium barbadense]
MGRAMPFQGSRPSSNPAIQSCHFNSYFDWLKGEFERRGISDQGQDPSHKDDEHLDDDPPPLRCPITTPPPPSPFIAAPVHSITIDDIFERFDRFE